MLKSGLTMQDQLHTSNSLGQKPWTAALALHCCFEFAQWFSWHDSSTPQMNMIPDANTGVTKGTLHIALNNPIHNKLYKNLPPWMLCHIQCYDMLYCTDWLKLSYDKSQETQKLICKRVQIHAFDVPYFNDRYVKCIYCMSYGVYGLNPPNHYIFCLTIMVNWYQWTRLQLVYLHRAQSTDKIRLCSMHL